MHKLTAAVGSTFVVLLAACADRQPPTSPLKAGPNASANAIGGQGMRTVQLFDACDHDSFAAAHIDCTRNGGVKLDQFIAEVTAHQSAGAWHFSASHIDMKVGETLVAQNTGGEVHSFTEVEHFGGGVVPFLNGLSGTPVPAPECVAGGLQLIDPGKSTSEVEDEEGTELYQCCIHPWMRAVVTKHKA